MQGQQQYGMVNQQMPGQPSHYAMNIQQPVARPAVQDWSSGLFGCCSDCSSCWFTICCPCCQYGKNYDKVHGKGCCSQGLCYWILESFLLGCCIHKGLRREIRERHHIQEGCNDCLVTFFCPACAICQEARELKTRG